MNIKILLCIISVSMNIFSSPAQKSNPSPKGKLFIIGGGSRSDKLLKKLIETAALGKTDHITVLPMSGADPDTSFYYIKQDLERFCPNVIANLNFTSDKINNKQWLDSLKTAKLIF